MAPDRCKGSKVLDVINDLNPNHIAPHLRLHLAIEKIELGYDVCLYARYVPYYENLSCVLEIRYRQRIQRRHVL